MEKANKEIVHREPEEQDILHRLFVVMPYEKLPDDFNERVMHRIQKENALREKKRKYLEIGGYASGIAAMLTICLLVIHFLDITIQFPKIELSVRSFPKLSLELFDSPSFQLSVFIGVITLFLLMVDSTIRRIKLK